MTTLCLTSTVCVLLIAKKRQFAVLYTRPLCGLDAGPSIVYVFPLPVLPYMNTVTCLPFSAVVTRGGQHLLNTSFCVEF